MGLDTTHNCWHGAYSAFMRWRQEIAKAAGLPPLDLMEGFFTSMDRKRGWTGGMPTFYLGPDVDDLTRSGIERLCAAAIRQRRRAV
jgi:hypothetical protein